jgi:hypothetical protein
MQGVKEIALLGSSSMRTDLLRNTYRGEALGRRIKDRPTGHGAADKPMRRDIER